MPSAVYAVFIETKAVNIAIPTIRTTDVINLGLLILCI